MYPDKATMEIFRGGRWRAAGVLRPEDFRQGYRGSSRFEYLLDYAVDNAAELLAPAAGLSCRYPVDFALHRKAGWPSRLGRGAEPLAGVPARRPGATAAVRE